MPSALSQTSTGYPRFKFDKIGARVAGRIVGFEDYQETEYETDVKKGVTKGDLKFYPSGDPVMGTRIHLETEPGDPTSRVTVWCSGKLMMKAVAGAFKAKGAEDLEIGGDLAIVHDAMDGRAKDYSAEYSRPETDEPPF